MFVVAVKTTSTSRTSSFAVCRQSHSHGRNLLSASKLHKILHIALLFTTKSFVKWASLCSKVAYFTWQCSLLCGVKWPTLLSVLFAPSIKRALLFAQKACNLL